MNTQKRQPSKWKTWHKIILGVLVFIFFLIGVAINADDSKKTASTQSPTEDSLSIRKKKLEKIFSAWDGSVKSMETAIKSLMNDPDSYKHVETSYMDNGSDTIFIKMKYSGTNAFNARVQQTATGWVDINGNLIELISNQ